jgi:hypothetical protein
VKYLGTQDVERFAARIEHHLPAYFGYSSRLRQAR